MGTLKKRIVKLFVVIALMAAFPTAHAQAASNCNLMPWVPFKSGSEIVYGLAASCTPTTSVRIVLKRWDAWHYVDVTSYTDWVGSYYNLGRRIPCNVTGDYETQVYYGSFPNNYTAWSSYAHIVC